MEKITDLLLSPRFKSFYWRTGAMALAGFLAIVADSLDVLSLSPAMIGIVGLVLGEITKALNNAAKGESLGFSR